MASPQPGILAPVPPLARYVTYQLRPGADPRKSLRALRDAVDGEQTVAGFGLSLVSLLECSVDELRVFPEFSGFGLDVPSTPAALWLWLRGKDRGEIYHRHCALDALLGDAFREDSMVDAFIHGSGRDLTGYEDGTENPKGKAAVAAAVNNRKGIAGSSFVAVQQWQHDMARFAAMPAKQQDHCIGRRRSDNEELDDAPESAHVKRTAQESFDPEAFVVRRSMPWVRGKDCGLLFTAFGNSFDAFEAQFRRMLGVEDGVMDALFEFTRPVTGAYFWCPPVKGGKLELSMLDL